MLLRVRSTDVERRQWVRSPTAGRRSTRRVVAMLSAWSIVMTGACGSRLSHQQMLLDARGGLTGGASSGGADQSAAAAGSNGGSPTSAGGNAPLAAQTGTGGPLAGAASSTAAGSAATPGARSA